MERYSIKVHSFGSYQIRFSCNVLHHTTTKEWPYYGSILYVPAAPAFTLDIRRWKEAVARVGGSVLLHGVGGEAGMHKSSFLIGRRVVPCMYCKQAALC